MNLRNTLCVNGKGHLEIGGCDCLELVKQYKTPLYVFDEVYIRSMMRVYRDAINNYYDGNGLVLYASKAFSCLAIYKIAEQENIGCDVVSGGELFTALKAGFPADKIYFHGNNKSEEELNSAVDAGVGGVVIDSYREADLLNGICKKFNKKQAVLVRINPGVEAHTHAYIQTARTDSKFGFSIADGTAANFVKHVLSLKNIELKGFHCHIGSQIFEKKSFVIAAEKMMSFIAGLKTEYGYEADILNLGGGFGIWYTDDDVKLTSADYSDYMKSIIDTVIGKAEELKLRKPFIMVEPGRSIIGEAGITLYTAGSVKDIPGVRKYIAIDGGMFENPRYALYQSKYTVVKCSNVNAPCTQKVSFAGKCCESGDLIGVDIPVPEITSGDVIAVLSTGAYHYSMASNYNRNTIPEAILVKDGKAEVIIKRQTYSDLIRNDVIPESLK